MNKRRMKIDALAAYFMNTCHQAMSDGEMKFGYTYSGSMIQMLSGTALYPVDIEDALDLNNNMRIVRTLLGCGIRPDVFRSLLLASAYSETRSWKKAIEMLAPLDSIHDRYCYFDFDKMYKKIKLGKCIGTKYNKATLLTEFGMLYDNYEDDGIAQKDADDTENFLPVLTGMLNLVADMEMVGRNELVINWMMTKEQLDGYREFWRGLSIPSFLAYGITAGTLINGKAERQDIGDNFTSDSKINEHIMASARRMSCPHGGYGTRNLAFDRKRRLWNVNDMDESLFDLIYSPIVMEDENGNETYYPNVSGMTGDKDDALEALEIGVMLGWLDEGTLKIRTNPVTRMPYVSRDAKTHGAYRQLEV